MACEVLLLQHSRLEEALRAGSVVPVTITRRRPTFGLVAKPPLSGVHGVTHRRSWVTASFPCGYALTLGALCRD